MTYRLNAADISSPARLGQGAWWRTQLPEELGRCTNDICVLEDGLALAYAQYHTRHDLQESGMMERNSRALTITLALEGESSTQGIDGQCFDFVAGHSTVTAFSSVRGERRFPGRRPIRQLRLIAHEPLLQRYRLEHLLEGVRDDQCARHVYFGKQGAIAQQLARSLVYLHGQDAGILDLQIAALSLLSEQTRAILPPTITAGRLGGGDQDRILQARDILLREFDRPLTIAYLCTVVGTNEFKLKQGFRQLFGTSPYRMLTDIRMERAWALLETGLPVSTVAYKVGYRHLSSFSAAFERYHGRTPKSIAGARRGV